MQHFEAGRLEEARTVGRRILQLDAQNPDALHVLGLVELRRGNNDFALLHLQHAAKAGPEKAVIFNSLGVAYRIHGKQDDAASCFLRAISLDPAFAEAHSNFASVLRIRGDLDQAITHCQEALRRKPSFAQAHSNLGNIYFDLRRYDDAASNFQNALSCQADFHEARINLAFTLRWQGRLHEALRLLFSGLTAAPDCLALRRALADALFGVKLATAGESERTLLASLCGDDNLSPRYLLHAILGLLKASPAFAELLHAAKCREDLFLSCPDAVEVFTSDRLLHAILPRAAIEDQDTEIVLTGLRRCILLNVSACSAKAREFPYLLARNGFLSEYAHFADEDEIRRVTEIESEVVARLQQQTFDPPGLEWPLALIALYRPLSQIRGAERLLGAPLTDWSHSFRLILLEQVINRRREMELARNIRSLTPVSDEISNAVRNQYERNPYPLWVSASYPEPRGIEELFQRVRPGGPSTSFPRPVPVLIAGCGTGHHPVQVSREYRGCEILAVDLSVASVAYASRMIEKLDILNIKFAQADILELASIERRFALIECVGVLHHMKDPLLGWRTLLGLLQYGGLMKIGLYSKQGRQSVHAARTFVQQQEYKPTPGDIRRCRRAIIDLPALHPARGAIDYGDFYTLNGCRDMIMHVKEHVFTLPQIAGLLEQLGMQFLAFDCNVATLARFDVMFGGAAERSDLLLWAKFEDANPNTFRNMYQFWCTMK